MPLNPEPPAPPTEVQGESGVTYWNKQVEVPGMGTADQVETPLDADGKPFTTPEGD